MGSTSSCTRHFKKLKLSDPSCAMGGTSESDYLTAPATETEHASTSSSSLFLSARSESMMERSESRGCSSIDEQIEHSKSHWSHVVEYDSDEEQVAEVSNAEVFKTLQMHPTWGSFFRTLDKYDVCELVMGKKFAEGGQAELYEAHIKWNDREDRDYVLKVFKKGTFLQHLQPQWPQGLLQFHAETQVLSEPELKRYNCDVVCGTLLKDGRFAFLLQREQADLRSHIERNTKLRAGGEDCGPFLKEDAEWIMYRVALGMDFLHGRNIIHRDLKASNVLVNVYGSSREVNCVVADYECSIGVLGTGFFRAPEILQACKDRNLSRRPELFTKEADVYGYGMTCYEILTGKLPFEGHFANDYDLVLKGQRPLTPKYVSEWTRRLLCRCWQSNPTARPSFREIINILSANSIEIREREEKRRRRIETKNLLRKAPY